MSRFKVGDKVRITANTNHSRNKVGDVGVITVDGGDSTMRVEVKGRSSDYGNWTRVSEMELITEGGEEVKANQRKTYRLLKAMPGHKAGTLFQEQCDDGTQPYSVIGDQHGPYTDLDVKLEFNNRSHVEDNPKWFVEVFQVEPQYMTREELDQWEAFKGRKKPGRKAVAKAPVTSAGKFKVGDTVRRTRDNFDGMYVGDTAKILRIDSRNGGLVLKGYGNRTHSSRSFELVELAKKSHWTPAKRKAHSAKLKAYWAAKKAA